MHTYTAGIGVVVSARILWVSTSRPSIGTVTRYCYLYWCVPLCDCSFVSKMDLGSNVSWPIFLLLLFNNNRTNTSTMVLFQVTAVLGRATWPMAWSPGKWREWTAAIGRWWAYSRPWSCTPSTLTAPRSREKSTSPSWVGPGTHSHSHTRSCVQPVTGWLVSFPCRPL